MALFSNVRQQQSSFLVEFRAGKMSTRGGGDTGTPMMVHPDKRKGLVYIHQSDDALMHFCWKDRTSGTVEDDLIVFPDDVEFVPVKQCTTGRVFLLKFKNSPRKLFFWMQEPKADKDDEHCRKVNELLNHPPAPGANRSGRGGAGAGSGPDMDQFAMMNQLLGLGGSGGGGSEERMDLQNALAGMDHQQLMQLLNLMGTGGSGGGGGGFGSFAEAASAAAPSLSRASPPSTAAATPATTQSRQPPTSRAAVTSSASATGRASAASTTAASAATTTTAGAPQQAVQLTDLRNILANIQGAAPTESPGDSDIQSVAQILERENTGSSTAAAAASASADKDSQQKQNDDKGGSAEGPPSKKDKPDDEGMDLD